MHKNPADAPTCGARTANGTPCQRRVKPGSGPCAYHASTLKQKLKAWARNNTAIFVLTVIGVVVGVIGSSGWAYDEFFKKPPPVAPIRAGFLQLGQDPWFRPQKLVMDNFSISLWLKNEGDAPVEGEVHYFEARIVPVAPDWQAQEQSTHAEMLSNALKFNADQIEKGFHGRPIGKGEGVWQTMTFPHISQDEIDAIMQGRARIFAYAWARWRDSAHDLDQCLYLQKPESLALEDKKLIWHFCSDVPPKK